MLRFEISAIDHGRRVESFLQNLMPAAPLSYLRKTIRGENFTVNGAVPSPDTILRLADVTALKETGKIRSFLDNSVHSPDILLENEQIIVFNKPSGMPIHRSAEHGSGNLMDQAREFLVKRDERAGRLYPVNRLDRGTSGAAVAAKSRIAAGDYGKLFQEGLVEKNYLVFATGALPDEGIMDSPLDGKEAVTTYRTLYRKDQVSLLAVRPLTGRTHQIRRHLAEIRHPLIGDNRYGGKRVRDFNNNALHAWSLTFPDPFNNCQRTIYAPVSPLFLNNMERLTGNSVSRIMASLVDQ